MHSAGRGWKDVKGKARFITSSSSFPAHKDTLQNVPQAAAIFSCNCKFLAYRCLRNTRIGHLVKNGSFTHQVSFLRSAGDEQLSQQITRQRDQLDEAMLAFNGFQKAAENVDKLMGVTRRCCQQLGVLSRVWRVLPKKVYGRVLGEYRIPLIVTTTYYSGEKYI